MDFTRSDRGYGVDSSRNLSKLLDSKSQLRRGTESITPSRHERGSGMTTLTFQSYKEACGSGDLGYDPDCGLLSFKDWTLLDV